MSDWRDRALKKGDVVYFSYSSEESEKTAEEIITWDLDKTYLDTKFETLTGLFKTAFEKSYQKRNVPGTGALVRALKLKAEEKTPDASLAIYFITASPPQLEPKIHEKLNLDGVFPYGIYFKDNIENLKPKRWWRLTKQVGYKLQSLLDMRVRLGSDIRQILWGDDSESDAVIYSLYSDICARRLDQKTLVNVLKHFFVTGAQTETIINLQNQLPVHDPVEKIYINLAEDTDAEYYLKFGRRVLPTFNSFQTALDLFQDGRLGEEEVVAVSTDLMTNYEFTIDEIERSLDDLIRRQILAQSTLEAIYPVLKARGIIHNDFTASVQAREVTSKIEGRVYELEGNFEPWVPEHIDYVHDYR